MPTLRVLAENSSDSLLVPSFRASAANFPTTSGLHTRRCLSIRRHTGAGSTAASSPASLWRQTPPPLAPSCHTFFITTGNRFRPTCINPSRRVRLDNSTSASQRSEENTDSCFHATFYARSRAALPRLSGPGRRWLVFGVKCPFGLPLAFIRCSCGDRLGWDGASAKVDDGEFCY